MTSFLIQPDHAMTPILAFDIETIPDVNGIRQLYDLPADLPDNEVVLFAQQQRRAKTGSDFMQRTKYSDFSLRVINGNLIF